MCYRSLLKRGTLLVLVATLAVTGCRRDKDKDNTTSTALTNTDDNGGYASDAARMEQTSNDVISIADVAAATGGSNLRTTQTTLGSCAVITNDTVSTPHMLTISFGNANCTCLDGKTRRGKILVSYAGRYKDSAGTHTISYSNYFVNDMQVLGSKTVTNMGTNGSGQVWYNVTVNDSLIIGTDSIVSWVGNRTRTWLAGYSTSDRSDDVYAIGGTTVLTRANGHIFTHTIANSSPLKIALACPWIESGIVTVSSASFANGDRTLDYSYGGGGCDNKVQLTIGTHTYIISMW